MIGRAQIHHPIGSPETDAAGGELLDYERELQLILDAVGPARRSGDAYVRVLHRGTVAAIREALEAQRFHVLYLSGHARPGERAGADAPAC